VITEKHEEVAVSNSHLLILDLKLVQKSW